MNEFRSKCTECPEFNFWNAYLDIETDDDDYNSDVFSRIEKDLLDWIGNNAIHDVYYHGDLEFYFESHDDCDNFEKEFSDSVAFKLRWL